MVSMQQTNDCVVRGDGTTESHTFTPLDRWLPFLLSQFLQSRSLFNHQNSPNPNPKWNYFVIVFQSLSHFRISLSLSAASSKFRTQFYAIRIQPTHKIAYDERLKSVFFSIHSVFACSASLPFNPIPLSEFTISSSVRRTAAAASRMGHNGGITKSLYMYDSIAGSRHSATIHATLDSKFNSNTRGFSFSFAFGAERQTQNRRQQRNSTSCAHSLPPLIPAQLAYSLKQSRSRYRLRILHMHINFLLLSTLAQFDVFFLSYFVFNFRCRRAEMVKKVQQQKIVTRKTDHRRHWSILCAHNSRFIVSSLFFFLSCSGPIRLSLLAPPPPPDWYTLYTHNALERFKTQIEF